MKLELFKFDSCPYCQRVLRELERSGRTDVELLDTLENPENQARLVREGGLDQVPCLFVDGKPLYESLDIIDWLKRHPQL
jgi:glutaredoxin